jgi:hypothetical protein
MGAGGVAVGYASYTVGYVVYQYPACLIMKWGG